MNESSMLSVIQSGEIDKCLEGSSIRVLGLDLGTTNSTISEAAWEIVSDALPQVQSLEVGQSTLQGEYTHVLLPSVVAIHGGKVFIGEGAKRLRSQASDLGIKQNQDLFFECKNDIGNRRTYHRAPTGFRSAAEIGGKVLDFLCKAAMESESRKADRVVVTVPASFQAAQRQDSLRAAELAGLELAGGDLLDEPVAAFLDYLITQGQELALQFDHPRTLLVFDFGGGTCDVAVFRLLRPTGRSIQLNVEALAVSRYHRLGGGDIDTAIVHEVLIPQLCQQNDLDPKDLHYEDKVKIKLALLGVAEMLKEGLCVEVRRLTSFGKYASADKGRVVKTQPGVHHCQLGERTLKLASPKLTAAELEDLLEPFLDQDLLFARETEYRMTCSIFAPLQDALDRAGIEPGLVDYCLAVGGSSLIPQVFDALKSFFAQGQVLTYPDRDAAKTCVSRGAAYHALALEAFGKALVQPVCHDEIAVRTSTGFVRLIPKGVKLPYPEDGSFAKTYELAVPHTVMLENCELRMEVVATSDERPLLTKVWSIPGPVNMGTPICMEYRLDENQALHLRARLKGSGEEDTFDASVENPLTNVVNPQPKRLRIEEMEEDLRTGRVPASEVPEKVATIADLYADLGQREKAIEFLRRAIRAKNQPDVYMLNRLAGYYGMVGDWDREEKVYREATNVAPWSGTWFNLSLALKRRGKLDEAEKAAAQAIALDRSPPYLVQAALIYELQGNSAKSRDLLSEAMTSFDPIRSLNDWELGWFITAAQAIDDQKKLSTAHAEKKKRSKRKGVVEDAEGDLPMVTPGLMSSPQ
jgi:molecular chaperone DnaK